MPRRRMRCGGVPPISSPSNSDAAALGAWKPGQHIDERGLAGAVGSDQARHLFARHVEAHIRKRVQALEGDRHLLG